MFHTCVQRFDGMDENFLGGELNRALVVTNTDQPKKHDALAAGCIMMKGTETIIFL